MSVSVRGQRMELDHFVLCRNAWPIVKQQTFIFIEVQAERL